MEPHERLRLARIAAGYSSAAEASRALGVKGPTYTHHENGTRTFDPELADRYAKRLQTSAEWLLYGKGEPPRKLKAMQDDAAPQEPLRVPVGQEFAPDPEWVDDPASAEAARRALRRDLLPGEILERDVTAGLGSGGEATVQIVEGQPTDGVRDVWRVPPRFLHTELRAREEDVDLVRVEGDSMRPTLEPGDRVMINKAHRIPSPDGLYALFDGVGVAVKRVESVFGTRPPRMRIISDNTQRHSSYELDAVEVADMIIGRVICIVKLM